MSFIDSFKDLFTQTMQVQEKIETVNGEGEPTEQWDPLGTPFSVGLWNDSTGIEIRGDKFVGVNDGFIVVDPKDISITLKDGQRGIINSNEYYFSGVDDVAFQGEVILIGFNKRNDQ